jgi:hypothetical protein
MDATRVCISKREEGAFSHEDGLALVEKTARPPTRDDPEPIAVRVPRENWIKHLFQRKRKLDQTEFNLIQTKQDTATAPCFRPNT